MHKLKLNLIEDNNIGGEWDCGRSCSQIVGIGSFVQSRDMSPSKTDPTQDERNHVRQERRRWFSVRYVQVVMMFFCMTVNYLMRINLSIAMVAMTNRNATESSYPVYNWSAKEKGVLFSAFFWGYLTSNIVGSMLVTRFNNKVLLVITVTYSSLATIMSSLVVDYGGLYAFIALRASIGLTQGIMMPSVTGLLSRWAPPNERARCGTLVLGGAQFGTLFSFATSGALASSAGGWPSIFYVSGGLSLAWTVIWFFLGAESPSTCSYISQPERKFIEESLIHTTNDRKRKIPWAKILTNKACYAVLIATTANTWGFWILVTQMPSFFSAVLHYDTTNNGLITAVPYLCLWLNLFPSSYVVDTLIRKKMMSVTVSRKICSTLGLCGPAAAMIALAYTENTTIAIIMYAVGVTFNGFIYMGFYINLLDICPNFSGLLMGITNGLSTILAILGPIFVGYVVYDDTDESLWRIVFDVSAAVFVVGSIFYLAFASGEVQPFNRVDEKVDDSDSEGEGTVYVPGSKNVYSSITNGEKVAKEPEFSPVLN